jgi:hypothetical protein
MNNEENNEEHREDVPEIASRYPEPDFSNPRKDGESWSSPLQQGDNNGGPEIQMGQYEDGAESRQYE